MAKTKTAKKTTTKEVIMERRSTERRSDADRRTQDSPVELERRQAPRRKKVARRRQIDPTTCERDYNQDEIEFMHALDAYKRAAGRMFPTCSEILEVIRDLGYRRLGPEEIAKLNPGPMVGGELGDAGVLPEAGAQTALAAEAAASPDGMDEDAMETQLIDDDGTLDEEVDLD